MTAKMLKFTTRLFKSTVEGRNPAPPGMYKTLQMMGYLPYQLVQDFFHEQYDYPCRKH